MSLDIKLNARNVGLVVGGLVGIGFGVALPFVTKENDIVTQNYFTEALLFTASAASAGYGLGIIVEETSKYVRKKMAQAYEKVFNEFLLSLRN